MYDTFTTRLNAVLQCDPTNCTKEACPLYRITDQKCTINQFLLMFNCVMHEKFANVDKYNPLDD